MRKVMRIQVQLLVSSVKDNSPAFNKGYNVYSFGWICFGEELIQLISEAAFCGAVELYWAATRGVSSFIDENKAENDFWEKLSV